MFGAAKRDKPFKDYCLILQVHPEADAAMIDAAYWHLAKRYNAAAAYDSQAKAKLEDLNEAYIVLGSAARREEYMETRTQVLGEGALPQAPRPEPPTPPLTVMARQQPQERQTQEAAAVRKGRFSSRSIAGLAVALGLAAVALATTTSAIAAVIVVGAILLATMTLVAAVAALTRLGRVSTNRARGRQRKSTRVALEKVRTYTPQGRDEQLPPAAPVEAVEPQPPQPDVSRADSPPSADIRPASADPVTPDGLKNIRQQAAAFRRIAQSQAQEPGVVQGDATSQTPVQAEEVRKQTERLKTIAAKFNAAKEAAEKPEDGDPS